MLFLFDVKNRWIKVCPSAFQLLEYERWEQLISGQIWILGPAPQRPNLGFWDWIGHFLGSLDLSGTFSRNFNEYAKKTWEKDKNALSGHFQIHLMVSRYERARESHFKICLMVGVCLNRAQQWPTAMWLLFSASRVRNLGLGGIQLRQRELSLFSPRIV